MYDSSWKFTRGVVSNHIQSIDISIGIRNGVAAIFDMLFFCKEVVKMNLLLPQNPRKIGVAKYAHEKTTSTIPKRTWLMWFFALELNYDEKL